MERSQPRSATVDALLLPGLIGGLTLMAGIAALAPDWLAPRFAPVPGVDRMQTLEAAQRLVRALAVPMLASAALSFAYWRRWHEHRRGVFFALACSAGVLSFCSLSWLLSDWVVDDAAITFAYGENLISGHGLVLHASLPPEEGYSDTLWLVILSFFRILGLPFPISAKAIGLAAGAASVALSLVVVRRMIPRDGFGVIVPVALAVVLQAPFVVWSNSGLEHGLQALLFLAVIYLCIEPTRARLYGVSFLLSLLVLLRPETPLIVAAVWAALAIHVARDRAGGDPRWLRTWPVAVVPAVTFLLLTAFRLSYFGDPLPNPFYAKAASATVLRLFNPVGGGWQYVSSWARDSGSLLIVPFLLQAPFAGATAPLLVAAAIVSAHLAFVISTGGDWMGCFRFISPIVPLVAIVAACGFSAATRSLRRRHAIVLSCSLALILSVLSSESLLRFRESPTTPMAVVMRERDAFTAVARKLGIDRPTLAHHDAGGTSYLSELTLIDLGGLGNRTIAKHMTDPRFVTDYLLLRERPDFIFGTKLHFAAARTQFYRDPRFAELYVPLRFVGMDVGRRFPPGTALCYVRRDVLHEAPGIEVQRNSRGEVVQVLVEDLDDPAGAGDG